MSTTEKVREQVRRHDSLYHDAGAPETSDQEYDGMRADLAEREARAPGPADSPTRRLDASPVKGAGPVVVHA